MCEECYMNTQTHSDEDTQTEQILDVNEGAQTLDVIPRQMIPRTTLDASQDDSQMDSQFADSIAHEAPDPQRF